MLVLLHSITSSSAHAAHTWLSQAVLVISDFYVFLVLLGSCLTLKKQFAEESILQMFDSKKLIIIKADTSDQVLDSVLSQWDESENLYLVVFYSHKFIESELNYMIHDKELLAIIKTFKQWKTYLKESKNLVQIYTDYKNLIYFTITKVLN